MLDGVFYVGPEDFGNWWSALPAMVKRVHPSFVRPWICGWVKANLCWGGRVYFANKGEGSVQVRVPGNRTGSKERRRRQGRSGID